MRRRGAGGVVRAAQGGRGRPRTSEGARARAQENLRARSIEKVPGQEGGVVEGRRPEPGLLPPEGVGIGVGKERMAGGEGQLPNGGLWGVLRASAAKLAYSRDKRAEPEHFFCICF
jgi:hypothetical protein